MSEESGVFFKLARDLSSEERNELLVRLSANASEAPEPLLPSESEDASKTSVDDYFGNMGLIRRLFLMIKALLAQRELREVVEDDYVGRIARSVTQSHPDIYQYRTGALCSGFFDRLGELQSKLSPLAEPLKTAFHADRRAFIAHLVSVLLPIEHERLVTASSPEQLPEEEQKNEFELRRTVQMATRDALSSIDKTSRGYVYAMYRSLHFLNQLVFHRLFKSVALERGTAEVTGTQYREELTEFCDILVSLGLRPSKSAVEAVVRYHSDSDGEEHEEHDLEVETNRGVEGVRELQRFCATVPIIDIARILHRNPAYAPDVLGGGEDWYTLYRQYWEERAERHVARHIYSRSVTEFKGQADALAGDPEEPLTAYVAASEPGDRSVAYPESARFLLAVAENLFQKEAGRLLKTLMVNGEFYKAGNREELTDSYNGMSAISDGIRAIDRDLGPEGDSGAAIARIEAEPLQTSVRTKRIDDVLRRVDTSMDEVIHQAMNHLETLCNVLKGVLYGESGGPYDTLVNIRAIAGSENKRYLQKLDRTLADLENARRLLHQVYDLEKPSATR